MGKRDDEIARLLELARGPAIVTTGEVRTIGVHHEYLGRLCAEGRLVRVDLGGLPTPPRETRGVGAIFALS